MRVLDCGLFKVKTKIPFSNWAEIIHTYLETQGLHYGKLYYYFEDLVSVDDTEKYDYAMKKGSCAKAQRDCPAFGDIHCYRFSEYTDHLYLSNIETPTECTEKDILPLMKKLHRYYGFSQCDLYYADIDFFQKMMPSEKDHVKDLSHYKIAGSGIHLHRDCLGENYICLSVDILHDGNLLDATPYFEAMESLMPGIKMTKERRVIFDEDAKRVLSECNKSAKPVVEKCISFLKKNFPYGVSQNYEYTKYSCAQALRKCAKESGFIYKKVEEAFFYCIEKKTERGNILQLEAACGPGHYRVEFEVIFKGMGFEYVLGWCSYSPANQTELETFIRKLIKILEKLEADFIPELASCYPVTPAWFFS